MNKIKKNFTVHYKKVRWICLTAIVICTLLYIKVDFDYINSLNRDHFMDGYFVNTSDCRIMALNPFSKNALSYFNDMRDLKCNKIKLFNAKTIDGKNYLVLSMARRQVLQICNVEQLSDVRCEYRIVKRYNDDANKYSELRHFRLDDSKKEIMIESGQIIIRIMCYGGMENSVYHDVHFFIPKPQVTRIATSKQSRLSAMIIGIDSVSHMQFLRSMPLLHAYINNLPHVEFWGYSRVGRNTYPNLVPLFTGLNVSELEDDCYVGQSSFDQCDFIWKYFKENGYKTCYAEDTFVGGTFNYGKWGFDKSPTDFYMRPIMLEIDRYTRYSIDKQEDIHCTGSRKYAEILHEFIYKIIPQLQNVSHFSFFWQSQGVHDYFSYPWLLDGEYLKLLIRLKDERVLDNTILFLMSDHGMRYGSFRSTYQGMLEESQPLLIAIFPKWLEEKYPLAISNLRKNSRSLVTTYDLYATLKDLTSLEELSYLNIVNRTSVLQNLTQEMPRGISLFLPIPEKRNCEKAGIPLAFCLCQTFSRANNTDEKIMQAARFIVRNINIWISNYDQCQIVELEDVLEAYVLNQNKVYQDIEVKVRIQTSPGDAEFEGIVRFISGSLMLNGPVLRTNKYGNQSYCVNDYKIEMYCYCK